MSEQNRTAPRWQDVVIPLVRNERARLEEHLAWTRQLPGAAETARVFREREGARIEARIAPLDAALARLAEPVRSAEGATAAEQLMREVCEALGWQGGTRDGALAAIRQAKRAADAAEAYDRELNETGGAGPAALIRESAAWRRVR